MNRFRGAHAPSRADVGAPADMPIQIRTARAPFDTREARVLPQKSLCIAINLEAQAGG